MTRSWALTLLLLFVALVTAGLGVHRLGRLGGNIDLEPVTLHLGQESETGRPESGTGVAWRPVGEPRPRAADPAALLARCFSPVPGLPTVPQPEQRLFGLVKSGARIASDVAGGAAGAGPTPEQERALGRHLAEEVLKKRKRDARVEPRQRAQRVLDRLSAELPATVLIEPVLEVLDSPRVNAFIMPGGRLFVMRGLITAMSDDELAMVLAHELGHQALGHTTELLRMVVAGRRYGELLDSALGEPGTDDGQGGRVGAKLGALAQTLLGATYDQDQEYESDRFGVCLLAQAGFSARRGAGVLHLLLRQPGADEQAPADGGARVAYDLLATHPPIPDRLRYVESLEAALGQPGPAREP